MKTKPCIHFPEQEIFCRLMVARLMSAGYTKSAINKKSNMSFELPDLPYPQNALEPHISGRTLSFHHGKHHRAYVTKLNAMTDNNKDKKTVDDHVMTATGTLFNQAAQVWNHTFYWHSLKPNSESKPNLPSGRVGEMIAKDFGSFEEFKKQFSASAAGEFGSGWAWLVFKDGKLAITTTHDAGNPLREGTGTPILACDVWEHAYYLDYQNDRPAYLSAWWSLVNWTFANENLTKCK
ncbi:MAG: uncharacterized protein KVP18_000496 [Porospora cf. gigantea A]|uniref:uncharacterized protein n=2 Tax=Porospora cf. gigantea A TaxID=2853593 RepID=UPI00355A2827|nr:MAG: hypothetical protein KVP18_000496 [Porospora cf. gigantea A]